MIQWIDLANHGFQLRGAAREGAPRRVVAVADPIDTELSESVGDRLAQLGFERSGVPAVWHREARGLTMTQLLALFPQGVLTQIAPDALFTAPYPGRDRSLLGRFAELLEKSRTGPSDMLGSGTALVEAVSQFRGVDRAGVWDRWSEFETIETIASADAQGIAHWMEAQLRTRALRSAEDQDRTEVDEVVPLPALRGLGAFAVGEAVSEWQRTSAAPAERRLNSDEERIRDVEGLLGSTPRVLLAWQCVSASRRTLAIEGARLESARVAADAAEAEARLAAWGPYTSPDPSASIADLMAAAGVDVSVPGIEIDAGSRIGWMPRGGAIALFVPAPEGTEFAVSESRSVAAHVIAAAQAGEAQIVARRAPAAGEEIPLVVLRQESGDAIALSEHFVHLVERLAPGGVWRGPNRSEAELALQRGGSGLAYMREGELIALVGPMVNTVVTMESYLPELMKRAATGFKTPRVDAAPRLAADGGGYRGVPMGPVRPAVVELDVSSWLPPVDDSQGAVALVPLRYFGVPSELAERAKAAHASGVSVPWADLDSLAYGRVAQDAERGHPVPFLAQVLPDKVLVSWRQQDLETTCTLLRNRQVHAATAWFLDSTPGSAPVIEVHAPYQPERVRNYKARTVIPANEALSVMVLRREVSGTEWTAAGVFDPVPALMLADDALSRGLVRLAHGDDPAIAQAFAAWEASLGAQALDDELRVGAVSESELDTEGASELGDDDGFDDDADTPDGATGRIEDFGAKIGGARKDISGLGSRALEVAMTERWTSDELREHLTKERLWPFSPKQRLAEGVDPGVVALEQKVRLYVRSDYTRFARGRQLTWSDDLARQWAAGVRVMASVFEGVQSVDALVARSRAAFDVSNPVARARLALTEGINVRRYRAYWKNTVGGLASADVSEHGAAVRSIAAMGRVLIASQERKEFRQDVRKQVNESRPKEKAPRISERPHLAEIGRTGPAIRTGDVSPETLGSTFGFRGGEFGNWLGQKERQEVLNFAFEAFHDLSRVLGVPAQAVGLNGELAIAFGARGTGGKRAGLAHYEPGRRVINLTRMNGAGSLGHEFAHAFDHYIARALAPRLKDAFATNEGPYLYAQRLSAAGLRPELAKAVSAVVEALHWYSPTAEEGIAAKRTQVSERMSALREGWAAELENPRGMFTWQIAGDDHDSVLADPAVAQGVQAVNASYMELCDRVREGIDAIDKAERMIEAAPEAACAEIQAAGDRIRDARDAVFRAWNRRALGSTASLNIALAGPSPNISVAASNADLAGRAILGWKAARELLPKRTSRFREPTQFLEDAKAIDAFEGRKNPYWTQPIEMFARAFECWVFDALKASGHHCDYLVHGVEDKGLVYADRQRRMNVDDVREVGNQRTLCPYPRGIERERINAAFDGLAKALQHEVTPEGHCRLYQRRPSPLGPGQGMSVESVARAVHRFRDALVNTCRIEVVAETSDLPAPAPADVAGFFDALSNTVYLVAANLRSPGDVNTTLTHEILRHAGLFALLGDQRERVLEAIWADNPTVRQRADALRSEGIEDGIVFSRTEATEEALAQLADEGALPMMSGWQRAAGWIRSALRDVGLGVVVGRWNDHDVAYLVSRAARASGLRPHVLPTAGSATPDHWMSRFLEAPRRALTVGAFLGSMIGAGVFGVPSAPSTGPQQASLTWPEIYAPQCVGDDFGRAEVARRWARFGMPPEAFANDVRYSLAADVERARAALAQEAGRLEVAFESAVDRAYTALAESTDPAEQHRASETLKALRAAHDGAYANVSDQVFANVDAQILAALNRECQQVADAFAPPVRWPDLRSLDVPEEETAAAPEVRAPSM